MKRKWSLFLAAVLAAVSITGCSSSNTADDGKPKPELNIIVAHNQTSLENPYSKAAIKFKEALEEVSGGRATAPCITEHWGRMNPNWWKSWRWVPFT